ncbi:MAG: DUF4397 domain-containing protein [Dehalococcoidia bacterium]|nr:DUF4397 domain-containing protein [Dehalococcoidia bacterium]
MAMLTFAAVPGASAQSGETGRVRIMHASPDTPAVDIFVDGEQAVSGLAFPDDTGYVELPAGTRNVQVFVSPSDGSGDPALEADLEVAAGSDYTVLATGILDDGSLGLLPLEDNNATPEAGNAHVRLIHASPDAPAVDVVANGELMVFSGVEFNNAAGPEPVPAGTYDLAVQLSSDGSTVLEVPGLSLADQTVYSIVAVGLAGDGSLQAIPLVDAEAPAGSDGSDDAGETPHAPGTGSAGLVATGSGSSAMIWFGLAGLTLVMAGAAGTLALRRQ